MPKKNKKSKKNNPKKKFKFISLKPEKVNSFNQKRLLELVKNGPNKWPGAKSIQKKNNIKIISL